MASNQGVDASKKIKGRKRHIAMDVLGLLLVVIISAASGPQHFAYEVTDFTNVLRLLVKRAKGSWTFMPVLDGGVAMRCSYHFTPEPGPRVLVRLIGPMWKCYVRERLTASIRETERVAALETSSVD